MSAHIIKEVTEDMIANGFGPGTEQYEICQKALSYLGFAYRQDEELISDNTIDCSTLVSQSHWEGAAIGMPFIAENQRTAPSGQSITSVEDLIPADVLIQYSCLNAVPDRTYNHVALYLGKDRKGKRWVIESKGKVGVTLTPLEIFNPQGGIKRFTLSRNTFTSDQAKRALKLTEYVPKFGRLGVRQYCKDGVQRITHKGIDIYLPEDTPVYASINGRVSIGLNMEEYSQQITITSEDATVRYMMLKNIYVAEGDLVNSGEKIGVIAKPSVKSKIRYSTFHHDISHLHVEVSSSDKISQNHLYLSKIGKIDLPIKI